MFGTASKSTRINPTSEPADESLSIRLARAGDLAAFNALVLRYQDGLYRWVLSLVGDEALAGDITQSTFITAYTRLTTFRGGSFRSWLFVIARNRSIDELRRIKRRASLSLDDVAGEHRALYATLPDPAPLPETILVASEQAETIDRLVNSLPDVFRQVVRLVDLEGMDYQEAARVLGQPIGTIKSRLARARLRMRSQLSEVL